jgi:hypothetical protein
MIINPYMFGGGGGGGGGIALVASVVTPGDASGDTFSTSPAIDTTGATLLVLGVTRFIEEIITDSYSNTWVRLNEYSVDPVCSLYYVKNPVVGAGHTFQYGNLTYSPAIVSAWSGTDTSANADQQNGATGSSPLSTGSITPSTDNQLVIALFGGRMASGTVSGGFTEIGDVAEDTRYGMVMAYQIQTSAAAVNPALTGVDVTGAAIASFKAA